MNKNYFKILKYKLKLMTPKNLRGKGWGSIISYRFCNLRTRVPVKRARNSEKLTSTVLAFLLEIEKIMN